MSMDLFFLSSGSTFALPMYPSIAIWGTTRKAYGALSFFFMFWLEAPLSFRHRVSLGDPQGSTPLTSQPSAAPIFNSWTAEVRLFPFYIGFGILAGVCLFIRVSRRPRARSHLSEHDSRWCAHESRRLRNPASRIFLCPLGWEYWAPLWLLWRPSVICLWNLCRTDPDRPSNMCGFFPAFLTWASWDWGSPRLP